MRKVRVLLIALILAAGCHSGQESGFNAGAPELLRAVPSDALAVGMFNRCDRALDRMLDSTNVLNSLPLGELRKHKAVVALCDVGTVVPLLIIQTGKAEPGEGLRAAADTLPQTAALAAQADSLQLFSEQISLDRHSALLISPSATIITVVRRHLSTETSILDAPHFDQALEAAGGAEAIVWRNSGATKLFPFELCGISRKQLGTFLKGAAEWTIARGDKLQTVQPQTDNYYSNFLKAAGDGRSMLAEAFPERSELIIDLPVADAKQWRQAYETMLDARVELESYNKRIKALRKSTGKSPLDWEKEQGIQEVVYVVTKDYSLNMIRTAKALKGPNKNSDVQVNPYTGFVNALYGAPFNPSDSCVVRRGHWLVSGPRAVLDTLKLGNRKNWPAMASAIVQIPGERLTCNQENFILWQDSNR